MHDIAVVGAGPVGTMLAVELARRGLDVVLLERRTSPSLHSRAIGIHPPSLTILERLGVALPLLERAVRITGGEVRCDGRLLGSLSFEAKDARHPFVASVPQFETERLLRDELERLRPGTLHMGVAVRGLRQHDGFVELATVAAEGFATEGFEADTAARPLCARLVVGADGARSTVRSLSGIRWRQQGRVRSYAMADFPDAPSGVQGEDRRDASAAGGAAPALRAVLYFERGGVVEALPLPSQRRRWVAMTDEHRADISAAELAAVIRARTGVELPSSAENGKASAFVAHQHRAERFVTGRVVLVGDAAHELSPIGGQGMNLGWLDAAELAPVLDAVLRASRSGTAGAADEAGAGTAAAAAALRSWERRRMRSARRAMWQAGFNMAMGARRRGLALGTRNALVRLLAAPPSGALLARAFTMRGL